LCARNRRREVARVLRRSARAQSRNFFKMLKTAIPQGLLRRHQLHGDIASHCRSARARRGNGCAEPLEGLGIACEKNFRKCTRASARITRIRCESSESPASDSRAAALAMTFWRQRRAVPTTIFRNFDDRGGTKIGRTRMSRHIPRV
jgi:hypothetical protein